MQTIYPVVRYNDAKAAIAWLKAALGFEEKEVYEGEGGTIAHATLALAGNLIMLGSGDTKAGGIYIALGSAAEIDAAYARAKATGSEIVRNLANTDYGSHEFGVRDPEGLLWSFGTYRPRAT